MPEAQGPLRATAQWSATPGPRCYLPQPNAMRPTVTFRLPDGSHHTLEHGDLIGRVALAALPLDDPRISEAHAFVSLREGRFWLLALRRLVAVGGRPVAEARLDHGVQVELADGLSVTVEALCLPERVWVIEAAGLPRAMLPSVCSLAAVPRPQLVARVEPDAHTVVWASTVGWMVRQGGQDRLLADPDRFDVDGVAFTVRTVPLEAGGPGVTLMPGGVHAPLRVIAHYTTAQILRDGEPPLVLPGVQARIVSELIALAGPAPWAVVAREIWPDEPDDIALRKRWDVALARLRQRLRAERVRPNLVRASGDGLIELVLAPGDTVEDRT